MAEPLKGSVLLVDDDPAVAKVLGALLAQAGLTRAHATNGAEALSLLGRKPIDVVVSDVRMPGMGGLELLGEVERAWPDVPVILLTAHGTVPLAVEAMKEGAADFILKPFDREEILFTHPQGAARSGRAAREAPRRRRRGAFVGRSTRDDRGAGAAGAGRRGHGHGADARRERHRQGAGRARRSTRQPPARRARS